MQKPEKGVNLQLENIPARAQIADQVVFMMAFNSPLSGTWLRSYWAKGKKH